MGREKSRAELPLVIGRPVLSFVRFLEETCSIRKRIFSTENGPPLCLKVTCASGSSRSASMRTATLPPTFTSLAFWISSHTQRFGIVGDVSTRERSSESSLWIFVAIIWLRDFCPSAENSSVNVTVHRSLSTEFTRNNPSAVRFRANANYVDFIGVAGVTIE